MIEETIFKGKKIFNIKDNKRILFSFGLRKAILIIENFEEIKKFVENNIKELQTENPQQP